MLRGLKNYVSACLASKSICVHILLCMLCIKNPSCMQGTNYMHASFAGQYIGTHILSCVITNTRTAQELLKERY